VTEGVSPARFYHEQLLGSGADRWLFDRRIWADAILGWQLGFVEKPLKGDEDYVGCLTIPYFDGLGRERTMRFRPIADRPHPQKYLSRPKDPAHLFGVQYSDYPKVYITEGELDAIVLWQLGRKAVGVPGASLWKPVWKWLFRNTEEVVLIMDGDDAGQTGAGKIYRSLESINVPVRNVRPPGGHDVNSLFIADPKELERLL